MLMIAPWCSSEPGKTVCQTKDVKEHVKLVSCPEELICFLPDYRMSKDEYYAHDSEQTNAGDTCNEK